MNKTVLFLPVLVLVTIPGCWGRKKVKRPDVFKEVNIPVAEGDSLRSFFNDEVDGFTLVEGDDVTSVHSDGSLNTNVDVAETDDFTWVEKTDDQAKEFQVVYFDFDSYNVRSDQHKALDTNIALAKKAVDEARFFGDDAQLPTIVIDGHACHSAGSRVYNLALSEKRAKVLADKLEEAGVPTECIKIVGRGSEAPAVDEDGNPISGDRTQQWANRRDELRMIYA